MKTKWIYGTATLLLIAAMSTACGSKNEIAKTVSGNTILTTTSAASKNNELKITPPGKQPSIDANVILEGRDATITYTTNNFQLSSDHMDKKNVDGEGHLHLYVDGKQKAMLSKNAPVKLNNLAAGRHEVKLELQQNDHTDIQAGKILYIDVK